MNKTITIIGLGYVGCVVSACLSKLGYKIIGVDKDSSKVDKINKGVPTIIEDSISEMIKTGVNENSISAVNNISDAVKHSSCTFLCVNTPNTDTGELNHEFLFTAAKEVALALENKNSYHVIVIRSTVSPGTGELIAAILEEESGLRRGKDFDVISNPEFLREGSAVKDFFDPGMTVLGINKNFNPIGVDYLKDIYSQVNAPIFEVQREVGETIKYVSNSWHAVKISFANEVSKIVNTLGVDPHELMKLFCQDKKLNISEKYLSPGFAYGGSCLPKDILGLLSLGVKNNIKTPLLQGTIDCNNDVVDNAFKLIQSQNSTKLAFFGLSFKESTDDLRGSQLVKLAKLLLAKNFDITFFDSNIMQSIEQQVNQKLILTELGEIYPRLASNQEQNILGKKIVISGAKFDFDILNNSAIETFIDLSKVCQKEFIESLGIKYIGLNW